MVEAAATGAGLAASGLLAGARDRALGVLSASFLLDQASIGLADLGVLDTLLVLAINQANIQPLTREQAARLMYGDLDNPAPDEDRRPVSISAAARSLGLPFETARRHIQRLAARDVIVMAGRGVIVPRAFLASPVYVQTVIAGHLRMRGFYLEARDAGLLDPLPPSAFPLGEPEPLRAAARIRSDFALRSAETLMQLVGDIVTTVIYLGVMDGAGRPVTIASLARTIGVPEETVRRRSQGLLKLGACEKTSLGLRVTQEMLQRPPASIFFRANVLHVHRLLSALAERGVTQRWNAEA